MTHGRSPEWKKAASIIARFARHSGKAARTSVQVLAIAWHAPTWLHGATFLPMRTREITYHDGRTELRGFMAAPDAGAGLPIVLVFHAWRGHDDFVRDEARKLADSGSIGFAVDMYGAGKLGTTNEECSALMTPFLQDRALLKRRLDTAFAAARAIDGADATRMGAMGFCFGGLCVLDAARHGIAGLRGVAAFHALFTPLSPVTAASSTQASATPTGAPITAKVLVLHGYDDPMATPEQLVAFAAEMNARQADWEVCAYGGTVHAFTNPEANNAAFGTLYQRRADHRARARTRDFWRECLA
jgi:dienelactone hydrolase